MPDRTQVQLIFLNAKSRFDLGELDVCLPQLLVAPIVDVRSQDVSALRERGPVVERDVGLDVEAEPRWATVRLEVDGEASRGALVLLEDAADLPAHRRRIERFLCARNAQL